MDVDIHETLLRNIRSNSDNSNEFFDSSETIVNLNSPSLIRYNISKKYFNFISDKKEKPIFDIDFDAIKEDGTKAYQLFGNVISSDFDHKFRLQKLNTINGLSYSLTTSSNNKSVKSNLILNQLLFMNQCEDDHLYKSKNTLKKIYFKSDNKLKNFKKLEDLLLLKSDATYKSNKSRLLFNIIYGSNYPAVQKNIVQHIMSNEATLQSNSHYIPLQITPTPNDNAFLSIPKEFKIIETFILKDFVTYLNFANYQKSVAEYYSDRDLNIYKIKRKGSLPLKYPMWLVKEAYLFILKQVCDDIELEKFFIIFYYKFIAGNNVCYNLPDGTVYKRHINNTNKSKCHNHNMSRFEYIEFLNCEFTKIISKLSFYLLLIEHCREQEIEIVNCFNNSDDELVLVVRNAPDMDLGIKSVFKQVFYIDEHNHGIDKMIEVFRFF